MTMVDVTRSTDQVGVTAAPVTDQDGVTAAPVSIEAGQDVLVQVAAHHSHLHHGGAHGDIMVSTGAHHGDIMVSRLSGERWIVFYFDRGWVWWGDRHYY